MMHFAEQKYTQVEKKKLLAMISLVALFILPEYAMAAVTGGAFKDVYDFVFGAATGYLGRSIAIIGGIIGMGYAAASGKVLPAIVGVMLAIFGSLGPAIINTLFKSALI